MTKVDMKKGRGDGVELETSAGVENYVLFVLQLKGEERKS